VNIHGLHGAIVLRYCIIARKPASFADGMVETTMEEVSNIV